MNHTVQKMMALLLILCLGLSVLTGCGAKAKDSGFVQDTMAVEAPAAMEEAESTQSANGAWYGDTPMEEPEETADTTDAPQTQMPAEQKNLSEKIIYSGYLYIETTTFDDAMHAIRTLVDSYGGFIESSSVSGDTWRGSDGTTRVINRYANYTLRVPCVKFDSFLQQSGTIGNVLSSNTTAQNITSQFTDREARKQSLQVQEERLLAMMEKTEDVESLIELESRLSDVRYEIESLERTLIDWQNQVDYSTVTLDLREVEAYTPTAAAQRSFAQKLKDAFSSGWKGFTSALQSLTLWLAEALPALILLAVLAAVAVPIVRAVRRGTKHRRERSAARQADLLAKMQQSRVDPLPEQPEDHT